MAGNFTSFSTISQSYQDNDVWMDDLQLYILFNSMSVISGQWVDGNERLCAIESRLG